MSFGKTLLFVYNAEGGVLPGMMNFPTKNGNILGKDVCNLSAITYSPVGMKKDWKRFVHDLGIPARFLNRNEFLAETGARLVTFPAILVQTGKDLLMLASSDEINRCRSLEDLIGLVQTGFANLG